MGNLNVAIRLILNEDCVNETFKNCLGFKLYPVNWWFSCGMRMIVA